MADQSATYPKRCRQTARRLRPILQKCYSCNCCNYNCVSRNSPKAIGDRVFIFAGPMHYIRQASFTAISVPFGEGCDAQHKHGSFLRTVMNDVVRPLRRAIVRLPQTEVGVHTDQEAFDLGFVRYHPESLKQLVEETAFSKREIQMMYRGFKQGCPTGIVEFEKFKEIYSQFFPRGGSSDYAHFVFNTFDRDKNGHISFDEFVLGLSVISRGSTDDKLRWVFNLYDTDQDGYLSKHDLSNIVTAVYDLTGTRPPVDRKTIDDQVLFMFSRMEKNPDDQISLEEFLIALAKDEAVCTSMCLFDTKI